MSSYSVVLTQDAQADLEDIYSYIIENDGTIAANHVLDQLLNTANTLSTFPEKGSFPRELQELGIHDFRQPSSKHTALSIKLSLNR